MLNKTHITIFGRNDHYLKALAIVLRETTGMPCTWEKLEENSELQIYSGSKQGIFILDLANFPADAGKVIAHLKVQDPDCKIICLHHVCSVSVAKRVMKWKADAYILKNHVVTDIERFLKTSFSGHFFTSEPISLISTYAI